MTTTELVLSALAKENTSSMFDARGTKFGLEIVVFKIYLNLFASTKFCIIFPSFPPGFREKLNKSILPLCIK